MCSVDSVEITQSMDYYIGLLREDRSDPSNCIIQYNAELSRAGLRKADLPPDILGPDDIAEMRKKLETMKENARAEGKTGSRVIYETDFFKDKDK